jgi:hypothetical protein
MEQRLEAGERAVRELKDRLDVMSGKTDWLQRFDGAFAAYPEFEDVVRLGRRFRLQGR